jgi:general secretion pathway protein L
MDIRQKAERAETERLLLETLHQQREITPFLVDIWEEASRILPDGAHAIKFRMSTNEKTYERSVELLGYAKSAAELPVLFANSELFSDPALTGPITPNEVVKRERFTLLTKVRERPSPPYSR